MDFVIDTCFVSSNDAITTRSGIRLNNTHSGSITNSSIVNNQYGIRVDGPTTASSKIKVTNNRFEGNKNNDILLLSSGKAMKIIGNDFASTLSRTGTDYPIFANTPGTDYNIIVDNTFVGDSYTVSAGTNSIIKDNIFNVPV
jgi:nitrous oxidase accessory protein NosD